MSKIILTGGGTAGHVTACLALIPKLSLRFNEIHYIGSIGGIEKNLLADFPDVRYHEIPCTKLRRSLALSNLAIPFRLVRSVRAAKKLIRAVQPDVIFGKGGFVTLPVALASGRIPLVLHESDKSMGLANRISARKASAICTTFELPIGVCTGTPLRKELFSGDAGRFRRTYQIDAPILLVIGGSQGAAALNAAVRENLSLLTSSFHVVHVTGQDKTVVSRAPRYTQFDYLKNPADVFAAADLVLTRGGANTLFELAALHKPMIIVPLPRGSGSRGDQEENAAYFAERGLAAVLSQDRLDYRSLSNAIRQTYADRDMFIKNTTSFHADGTDAVLDVLFGYLKKPDGGENREKNR